MDSKDEDELLLFAENLIAIILELCSNFSTEDIKELQSFKEFLPEILDLENIDGLDIKLSALNNIDYHSSSIEEVFAMEDEMLTENINSKKTIFSKITQLFELLNIAENQLDEGSMSLIDNNKKRILSALKEVPEVFDLLETLDKVDDGIKQEDKLMSLDVNYYEEDLMQVGENLGSRNDLLDKIEEQSLKDLNNNLFQDEILGEEINEVLENKMLKSKDGELKGLSTSRFGHVSQNKRLSKTDKTEYKTIQSLDLLKMSEEEYEQSQLEKLSINKDVTSKMSNKDIVDRQKIKYNHSLHRKNIPGNLRMSIKRKEENMTGRFSLESRSLHDAKLKQFFYLSNKQDISYLSDISIQEDVSHLSDLNLDLLDLDIEDEAVDIKSENYIDFNQLLKTESQSETLNISSDTEVRQEGIYEQVVKELDTVRTDGKNQIEIQLEPESLGKVKLNLELDNGRVTVTFNVENSLVKEKLEQNLYQLRDNFLRQGYSVDHIQVETDNYESAYRQQDNPQENQDNPFYQEEQRQNNSQYDGMTAKEIYQLFQEEEEFYGYYPSQIINYRYIYNSSGMNYLI